MGNLKFSDLGRLMALTASACGSLDGSPARVPELGG